MAQFKDFPCDVCGSDDAEPIEVTRQYFGGTALHVCRNCGFVHVRSRRSAATIAEDWSNNLFGNHYTAYHPYMKARHYFLAEILNNEIDLKGKAVCDIGAGEGQFLDICRGLEYGASVFGIEPSKRNCELMSEQGIDCFAGTIEDYAASEKTGDRRFDVVTLMWTLENCEDPKLMLNAAHNILNNGGVIQLTTSSRILVPFRKPLHFYLSDDTPPDTHAFRFSANTQRGILAECGFEVVFENRYIDHDVLTMIARKMDSSKTIDWPGDDYKKVIAFFDRWHDDTVEFWSNQ